MEINAKSANLNRDKLFLRKFCFNFNFEKLLSAPAEVIGIANNILRATFENEPNDFLTNVNVC